MTHINFNTLDVFQRLLDKYFHRGYILTKSSNKSFTINIYTRVVINFVFKTVDDYFLIKFKDMEFIFYTITDISEFLCELMLKFSERKTFDYLSNLDYDTVSFCENTKTFTIDDIYHNRFILSKDKLIVQLKMRNIQANNSLQTYEENKMLKKVYKKYYNKYYKKSSNIFNKILNSLLSMV